jgi:hypothetical protein
VRVETHGNTETGRPGRGLAIASIALVPGVAVAFAVGVVVGSLVQQALGLAEDESLRAAGAAGVLAALALIALLCAPQAIGLWLGLRARRLGQRGLATAGILANGLLLAYLLVANGLGLLLA